jgi:hypothetical protein
MEEPDYKSQLPTPNPNRPEQEWAVGRFLGTVPDPPFIGGGPPIPVCFYELVNLPQEVLDDPLGSMAPGVPWAPPHE